MSFNELREGAEVITEIPVRISVKPSSPKETRRLCCTNLQNCQQRYGDITITAVMAITVIRSYTALEYTLAGSRSVLLPRRCVAKVLLRGAPKGYFSGWSVFFARRNSSDTRPNRFAGSYKAEQYDSPTNSYSTHPDLKIYISVEEVFDNDHRVVSQRGAHSGKFTFSAADSGDHRICFTPSQYGAGGGWLSGGQQQGIIKLSLDLAIGETSAIESTDKGKINDIVQKVKDLNGRLQDIRREQVFQRVCFDDFFTSKIPY